MIPYPASISATYNTGDTLDSERPIKRIFSNGAAIRYALVIDASIGSGGGLQMLKSTDSGVTWGSALDSAGAPVICTDTNSPECDAIIDPDDPTQIVVLWLAPATATVDPTNAYELVGEYTINTFTMGPDSWGTPSTGGPQAASGAAMDAGEVWEGAFFNLCKDTATGLYWISYCDFLVDLNFGQLWQRPCINSYDPSGGGWGGVIEMMTSTDKRNVRPAGIAIGDSSRVHLYCSAYDINTSSVETNELVYYHQSYLSGVLSSIQLIADHGFEAGGVFTNTGSNLVTRQVSGSTEILFGYAYSPNVFADGAPYFANATPRIARAMSAAEPTWTIEDMPGIDATNLPNAEDGEGVSWCAPIVSGSTLINYWNHINGTFPNIDVQVFYSTWSGSAWSAPLPVFASALSFRYGAYAFCALVNNGAALAALITDGANVAPANGGDYYYEIALSTGPTFAARYRVR